MLPLLIACFRSREIIAQIFIEDWLHTTRKIDLVLFPECIQVGHISFVLICLELKDLLPSLRVQAQIVLELGHSAIVTLFVEVNKQHPQNIHYGEDPSEKLR